MKASESRASWLAALRIYLPFILLANLFWEVLQLPLYTIWQQGNAGEIAFAVLHCTGGDLLIALSALTLALVLFGHPQWPQQRFRSVAGCTVILGVAYTIFSEWLNINIRQSWAYSEFMPVVPLFDVGLSPLLQWLFIPSIGLLLARRVAQRSNSYGQLRSHRRPYAR